MPTKGLADARVDLGTVPANIGLAMNNIYWSLVSYVFVVTYMVVMKHGIPGAWYPFDAPAGASPIQLLAGDIPRHGWLDHLLKGGIFVHWDIPTFSELFVRFDEVLRIETYLQQRAYSHI